jgi:hypothetical protein
MSQPTTRSTLLWLLCATVLSGCGALWAVLSFGWAILNSDAERILAEQQVVEAAATPQRVQQAPPDLAADIVHARWVKAMLNGDTAVALPLYTEPDVAKRSEDVTGYIAMTSIVMDVRELSRLNGRYLHSHRLLGTILGGDTNRRVGFVEILFERGSPCFATHMVRVNGRWMVEKWEPALSRDCVALRG